VTTRHGLTIIETLIAVAVIGVVFVALASVQISSMRVTTDARTDSDLLQVAVTAFEEARTIILANFESVYASCPTTGSCGEALFRDVTSGKSGYHVYGILAQRAGGDVTEIDESGGEKTTFPGLLELEVRVRDTRGRELLFKQYVSCLDANEVPALADPSVCEEP
jgi:prepilin-type N-terminal cleavage/methylation domain-containing protein